MASCLGYERVRDVLFRNVKCFLVTQSEAACPQLLAVFAAPVDYGVNPALSLRAGRVVPASSWRAVDVVVPLWCCHCSGFLTLPPLHVAKYNRVPQPRGSQRVPLPAGGHGRTPLHAASGEGGTDGWHSHLEGPACGTAR